MARKTIRSRIRKWVWLVSGAQAELDKQDRHMLLVRRTLGDALENLRKARGRKIGALMGGSKKASSEDYPYSSAHITEEGMEYRVQEPYRPKE
jgi:hypothetical protein